jgi:hypothetical protein
VGHSGSIVKEKYSLKIVIVSSARHSVTFKIINVFFRYDAYGTSPRSPRVAARHSAASAVRFYRYSFL